MFILAVYFIVRNKLRFFGLFIKPYSWNTRYFLETQLWLTALLFSVNSCITAGCITRRFYGVFVGFQKVQGRGHWIVKNAHNICFVTNTAVLISSLENAKILVVTVKKTSEIMYIGTSLSERQFLNSLYGLYLLELGMAQECVMWENLPD